MAIVDDEPSVRVGLLRLCNAFGLSATAYPSGRSFLDAVDTGESPDCVLLDTQMPGMTGYELQRQLLRRATSIAMIALTADDAPEARLRCAAAGVAGYLLKPVGSDELLAAIAAAVRPARQCCRPLD